MDLGQAGEGTVVTPRRGPIVAITSEQPYMLREICDDDDACHIERDTLEGLDEGSAVLITATGSYAVGIDSNNTIHSYEILEQRDEDGHFVRLRASMVASADDQDHTTHLVAGLRNSDFVITRTAGGELGVYYPGGSRTTVVADDIPNLRVIAVGERYLVGWQPVGEGEEALYLVPVHPDAKGRPQRLVRKSETFSRVVLTPGDARVVATSGSGDDARTFVFSVPDGAFNTFSGALVSGRAPGEELPGLRAVSPDGSHVVYRKPTGALAMRNLDTQASCLVRSSHAGDHQLAGFAPNGVLFMEATEKVGASRVLTLDPITGTLAGLGEPDGSYHLSAVAAHMPEPSVDRESMAHWAVAVNGGNYHAISSDGPSTSLGLHDVTFMARDDGGVWLLDTERVRSDRTLTVRRIAPTQREGALRFSRADASGPRYVDHDDGSEHHVFETQLPAARDICAALGIPGAWGYQCSGNLGGGKFLSAGPGAQGTEDRNPTPELDEPEPADGGE